MKNVKWEPGDIYVFYTVQGFDGLFVVFLASRHMVRLPPVLHGGDRCR